MLFIAPAVLALATAASARSLVNRQSSSTTNVTSATYDGKCFYPTPDPNFPDLSEFLGRWYQVAGTYEIFETGCTCIYAEYSLNTDGSVNVTNACQLFGRANNIQGTATPVDAAYGAGGVFQVKFNSVPGGGVICPGPNYIVQKYDGDNGWAIVQGPDFATLFLLSREQSRTDAEIDTWLAKAEALGTNLSLVSKVTQTGCKYT